MGLNCQKILEYIALNATKLKDKLKSLLSLEKYIEAKTLLIQDNFEPEDRYAHTETLKYLISLEKNRIKRINMMHEIKSKAFKLAEEDLEIETIKKLLSSINNPKARTKLLHCAFYVVSRYGHTETRKYLLSLEQDPIKRSKMIHANEDRAFRHAITVGKTDALEYLLSLEQNPIKRSQMIHANSDETFCRTAAGGKTDALIYLLSLEQNPVKRSKMIHIVDDKAFKLAARNGHTVTLKYLVVSDPFYKLPWLKNITELEYYKNIDIKSLYKISTLCKYLFSDNMEAVKNNVDEISIIDLPTDILYKIAQNLAQVNDEHVNQVKIESAVKAFTYEISSYSDGFKGFTYRYESALKELGAIENITNDLE